MSAVQHTPGPWLHATDMGQVGSVEFADGTVIAQAQQLPGDLRSEQRNANARLIAAAPELLAALRRCRFDSLNMTLADMEFCRAAIAKATGEQP